MQYHVVQDVFSEVLAAAGRDGYVSAEAVPEDVPLTDQISASWSDWFDSERRGGCYLNDGESERLKQPYGELLLRAYEEGGYADPKAFLQSLSSDELAVVQDVHHLADPIRVDSLSEEGAVNLLIPPAAQIDLNRDGFTRCGAAYGMRFPDSNTPAPVAEAWDEATADMPLGDRMTFEMQMMLPLLTTNIVVNDAGEFVRIREPGDTDFVNPMASSNYSYVQVTQDRLEYLEAYRYQMPTGQYEKGVAFWTRFQELLVEHDAN